MNTTAAETWGAVLDRYAASGLTAREFADKHGYNRSTLSWWKWRLRDRRVGATQSSTAFVELVPTAGPRRAPVRIRPDGRGFTIEVDPQTDLDLVARLLDRIA